ncbi:hypothetical protein JX266_004652 [Neoarthrinium moseri]|nr:hypothetical protein JX266_004652 [Neoarthrinium moseri]
MSSYPSQPSTSNWEGAAAAGQSASHSQPAKLPLPSQLIRQPQSLNDDKRPMYIFGKYSLEPDTVIPKREREPTGHTIADIVSTVEEDGRTYHGYMAGEYSLPNDGEEQDRQDFQHTLYSILLDGKLATAPVNSPRHVLDIGTGTGIWALEYAEANPDSHVIGTDLSLIQPPPRTSNCEFILENSETEDWIFPYLFDYVHLRSMGPCFNDLQTVIQKAFNHMAPGGWIEFLDGLWQPQSADGTMENTALDKWFKFVVIGAAKSGRDMIKAKFFKQHLEAAGFINVVEHIIPSPFSPWPKDRKLKKSGAFAGTALITAVDSYRKVLGFAGVPPAEIEDLTEAAKKDILNLNIHGYMLVYNVYGQKPPAVQ